MGSIENHYSQLVAAVNRGDILMFRSWFADPANAMVKRISTQSKFKVR
jgi:hypothetical protein